MRGENTVSDILERVRASLPQVSGEVALGGLEQDVEVIRDKQGVPHIYAKNHGDLFMAQGFVMAQDRLWQMELIRRSTNGTLSEVFGESTLGSDVFYRNLGFNRLAEKVPAQAGGRNSEDHIAMLDAYNAGINEYISLNLERLPIGFQLLQFKPENFTTRDALLSVLAVAFGLTDTNFYKLLRLDLIEKLGHKAARSLYPVDGTPSYAGQTEYDYLAHHEGTAGSNNWVVSGRKSVSGKPLLANDPHLMVTIPGLWYQNHLSAPDLSVAGFSLPGLPGVIIGHNEHIGWGCTNSCADVQDLYIERINPENPAQYRYGERWVDFEVLKETIEVKGGDPLEKEYLWSKHGPILESLFIGGLGGISYLPIARKYGIAYKSIENELDVSELFAAILLLNKARNWNDFKEAVKHWTIASQNIVYADVDGNIGYYMSGKVPIRKRGEGVVPVPGWTDEYEWAGFIPFDEMPQSFNPGAEFIVTANNRVVAPDYPYLISHHYVDPSRAERITELLQETPKLGVEDFKRNQQDVFSRRAKDICEYLVKVTPANEQQREAIEILKNWDHQLRAESSAALIYQVWTRKFLEVLLHDRLGHTLYVQFMIAGQDILHLLKHPSAWPSSEESELSTKFRESMLRDSLQLAVDEITAKHGNDLGSWRWGSEHHITFRHPLSALHPDLKMLNRGPFELPGDNFTVNALWRMSLDSFRCVGGASFRMILDFNDLGKSVAIAPPGQSGHPMSEHYSDRIDPWVKGEYHQMLFARGDVEREKKTTLVLRCK